MEIQRDISLKGYNTFGIDVKAPFFMRFNNEKILAEILEARVRITGTDSLMILGGGSNILFTKTPIGLVLKNDIPGIDILSESEDDVIIKVGAGVAWHTFVMYCVENNFNGLENLSLIPGSTGASPMQNIGAYGVELKDMFLSLDAWHIQDNVKVVFNKEECEFGYRESVFKRKFKNQFVITSVTFKLSKRDVFNTSYGAIKQELEKLNVTRINAKAISDAVIAIRKSKLPDPAVIGNAGSFFKNPVITAKQYEQLKELHPGVVGYKAGDSYKIAAGWLIEQCGWKGYRRGDVGCHERQALVLVNFDKATGKDVVALSKDIIADVEKKFSIGLETEVNII